MKWSAAWVLFIVLAVKSVEKACKNCFWVGTVRGRERKIVLRHKPSTSEVWRERPCGETLEYGNMAKALPYQEALNR